MEQYKSKSDIAPFILNLWLFEMTKNHFVYKILSYFGSYWAKIFLPLWDHTDLL